MKKYILLVTTLLFSHGSMAGTITWDSLTNPVSENAIFSLDIIGTGFGDIVDGGGVDFTFDPSVLQILSISIDAGVWDFFPVTGTINNIAGTVNGIEVNAALSTITGDFIVASVQFQTIGSPGTSSTLALSEFIDNPWASGVSPITPLDFVNGNVSVVPVPAAVWLFGSGLLALTALGRRKRQV